MGILHFGCSALLSTLTLNSVSALPTSAALAKRDADGPWFTDFPDPGLVKAGDEFYSFATNSGPYHIPAACSSDISSGWQYLTNDSDSSKHFDALPELPSWVPAAYQQVWAPDVAKMDNGNYSMLFCAANVNSPSPDAPNDPTKNFFCLGQAYSSNPFGPFEPTDTPVKCDDSGRGVIDPAHFTDSDGTLYYLWRRAYTAAIFIQQFDTSTGQKAIGDPSMLIEAPSDSLADTREAPYMIKASDGTYYLFYSTGVFSQSDYTVSWANGTSPIGPFTEQGALLKTGSPTKGGDTLLGPGGATLIPTGKSDEWYMAFHGLSSVGGPRPLYTAIINIKDGKPVVR